ncbi:hypothetical protein R3P38DRAFT_3608250 [Favolaschia claudopus]|uniref:Ricin B lectin domain-containing protein n=1 Tax=Favolaschia claudopus TaxID=2862362 RepID=A0AAW0DH81_9AGAR
MVNFLHNITALAGVATLVNIADFKSQLINLSGSGSAVGTPIISFPRTAGAENQDWMIIPQADGTTFTIQSLAQPALFVSYATVLGEAGPAVNSQTVGSLSNPIVFKMQTVGSGPKVNLIDTATGLALTSWVNADAVTYASPSTPVTMEALNNPLSFMQSFTVTGS